MNKKSISLASLAISVSAAAMLGVSGIAEGDQPGACLEGASCSVPFNEGEVAGVCGGGMEGCSCAAVNPHNPAEVVVVQSNQCGGE
jgi:hypothetical protein